MGKSIHIEQRTKDFIQFVGEQQDVEDFPTNEELAKLLGYSGKSSITEILKSRSNIPPDKWEFFKKKYKVRDGYAGTNKSVLAPGAIMPEDNQDLRKLNITVNALHKSIEGYKATLLVLQEFVIRRVVAKDKVPREAVEREMDSLLEDLKMKNPLWGIHTGSDINDSSVE